MASPRAFALVLLLSTLGTRQTRAQSATCRNGWEWMNNTAGKDPCDMLVSLESRCLGGQLVLPPLNGTVYAPPDDTNSQWAVCDCSSPVYSLYSACAACQGAEWVKWSEWAHVCGVAHLGVFPDEYYITTPVPHWAFINVTINDTFVPDTAKLVGGLPEQRVDGPTTTITLPYTSTLFPAMSTGRTSSLPSSSSSSSSNLPSVTQTDAPGAKTPVGAIAGGTIGGLAVLFLTGFAIVFVRKQGGLKIPKIRKASGPISLFDSSEPRPDPKAEEATAVKLPLLYDPTDPATFSRVNAELERPLQSASVTERSSISDPRRPPQLQPLIQ